MTIRLAFDILKYPSHSLPHIDITSVTTLLEEIMKAITIDASSGTPRKTPWITIASGSKGNPAHVPVGERQVRVVSMPPINGYPHSRDALRSLPSRLERVEFDRDPESVSEPYLLYPTYGTADDSSQNTAALILLRLPTNQYSSSFNIPEGDARIIAQGNDCLLVALASDSTIRFERKFSSQKKARTIGGNHDLIIRNSGGITVGKCKDVFR